MKKYGIYLAYPPTTDLRNEGLGRQLAEFLKAAQERGDIRFVIACPSWMRSSLADLFVSKSIHFDSFEFLSPTTKPLILAIYERYTAFKNRPNRRGVLLSVMPFFREQFARVQIWAERKIVGTRSLASLLLLALSGIPILAVGVVSAALLLTILLPLYFFGRNMGIAAHKIFTFKALSDRIGLVLRQPKEDSGVMRWYRLMLEAEISLLHDMINGRRDISAWYSPTAFWPHFHKIKAPRLMCVPDVVLADFPVGFAPLGGGRRLEAFRAIEQAIRGGEFFVTYSDEIKWRTLVHRYQVEHTAIHVIAHGANRLDSLVTVSGFPDNETATETLCRNFFQSALSKARGIANAGIYGGNEVRFLFYASQFRPNKNIISLLRAYEHLLKRRYIGHKLVLTGIPEMVPEVAQFILEHNLANDVLCLHGLSEYELAACYRLADLAINPSLSEGGCPFTFCEALSLGTPVVMARIAVTEEVITDPQLQTLMFFDPYDWQDMAVRIEWALQNLSMLKAQQMPVYEKLIRRTWRTVVDEHIELLDRISTTAPVAAIVENVH
ncbi:MAG: glycosyltransferase [Pseudomonadota bacterium]